MVSQEASDNATPAAYQATSLRCKKTQTHKKYQGSPFHSIRRRLSIGISGSPNVGRSHSFSVPNRADRTKNDSGDLDNALNQTCDFPHDSGATSKKIQRHMENALKVMSPLENSSSAKGLNSKASSYRNPLDGNAEHTPHCHSPRPVSTSLCASCLGYLRAECRCKRPISRCSRKEVNRSRYSTLASDVSQIAELSAANNIRLQRHTPIRSSVPITARDHRACYGRGDTANLLGPSKLWKLIEDEVSDDDISSVSRSTFSSSPGASSMSPASSNESMSDKTGNDFKSFVSPTRYDALEESIVENAGDMSTTCVADDACRNDEFTLLSESSVIDEEIPHKTKLRGRRMSFDIGQMLFHREAKPVKKSSGKLRRLAKEQMKMWAQRRHTIDTEDQNRRHQSMLRMSSSGRISLRQRNHSTEKRLSLFGNPTESLMTLLQHPEMLQAFRTFLKSEYSEENLDFYLECEEYKTTKPYRRKKMAAKIYATYLDARAPREINIDAGTRARTESRLENPEENTFEEAQKHIFDLMERDSFRRFVTTDKQA